MCEPRLPVLKPVCSVAARNPDQVVACVALTGRGGQGLPKPGLRRAALTVVFGLWLAWFVSAELPIYAVSEEARLEVARAIYEVAAVGGEVLFELDSQLERRRPVCYA